MKKDESKEFDPRKKYYDFMNRYIGFMGKDTIKKMFYAKAYLIYLSKKRDITKDTPCIGDFLKLVGEEGPVFNRLLEKLLSIYEHSDNTKEYLILKGIKELFEENQEAIDEELDDKLYDVMMALKEEEVKEVFLESSLEFKMYQSREDDASTKEISELVRRLLKIKGNDEVLDLCSGNGDFLTSLTKNKGIKLNGIEINKGRALISMIRLAVLAEDNAEILVKDALTYDINKEFDKIFCEYPLGLKVDNYRINQSNDNLFYSWKNPGLTPDWMFINKIVTLLKPTGYAAIIVTDAPLFKSMDLSYRRELVISGALKCVIKLPNGILPNTNIAPNLLILSKGDKENYYGNAKVKFVDATQEYIENKHKERILNVDAIVELVNGIKDNINDNYEVKTEKLKNKNKVIVLKAEEILCINDALLTVNSYLKKKEPNYINPRKLKEFIVDRYRGYRISSKEQAEIEDINGDYELLTVGDINEGKISDNLLKINNNNHKHDRYLLEDGDVVISSKGTKIKVAVAEIGNRKIMPNGNIVVVRLNKEKLEPYYLQAYLNTDNGQLALEQIQTGAKIISINPSRIEQINVSMVGKKVQEAFVEKYKRKKEELRKKEEEVKRLKEEIETLFENEIEERHQNE